MIESFDYNYFLSMASWNHFFRVHDQGLVILDHPDFQPNGKTEYIYDPAIIGTSTSSYTENEVILNTIQQLHVNGEKNNFNNVIVVGDQQTFDRMNALIRARPGQYPWAIPMNGDFHFTAHTVACFHNLYYTHLTAWVVTKLGSGFEKVIKDQDDNIASFKHYDHFYLLLTIAIVTFLHDTFDMVTLLAPWELLEGVCEHQGLPLPVLRIS